jgi:hypothetical protein
MEKKKFLNAKIAIITSALILILYAGGSILVKDLPQAFGGGFIPQTAQQGGRYQIAGCDGHSAWVIDTAMGDVYMIYSNGKWKEVGSIMDEKKRIKK